MLQLALALVAGALTIGAPCILPLLPILLASSVGHRSRLRPLFIIIGFILSFSVVALGLSYAVTRLMIAPDVLRTAAVIGLAIFGFFMLVPRLFEKLTAPLSALTNRAGRASARTGSGNGGGFMLGLLLGIIWTPCAGPVLGTILTLIATSTDSFRAGGLLIAYAIGAGLPMLAVAYGSQYLTTRIQAIARHAVMIQKVFGVIVIAIAIAMFFEYDLVIQARLLEYYPMLTPKL